MSEKGKILLAYILGIIGGVVVLFGMKDSERETKVCAGQSIILSGIYTIMLIIYGIIQIWIPFFTLILGLVYIAATVWAIVKALKSEDPELPGIGKLANIIFGTVIDG